MPDRTSPDWPSQLERGIAERALPGEARSGDHAVFVTRARGALVAAIDGLGHGEEAADAADIAADVLAHRLVLSFDAVAEGVDPRSIVQTILAAVPKPRVAPDDEVLAA